MNVKHVGVKTCMDCGQEFRAVINPKTREPIGAHYYGKMDQNMLKFDWSMMWILPDERERLIAEQPLYKRILNKIIPYYYFDFWQVSVKPWHKRVLLKIKWFFKKKNEVEMWTCPECVEKEEKEYQRKLSMLPIPLEDGDILL